MATSAMRLQTLQIIMGKINKLSHQEVFSFSIHTNITFFFVLVILQCLPLATKLFVQQ